MELVKKFQISLAKWLRGEGSDHSSLLRPIDGKQCCVGFYLEACGISRDLLYDKLTAHGIARRGGRGDVPSWLVAGAFSPSSDATGLYRINDIPEESLCQGLEEL